MRLFFFSTFVCFIALAAPAYGEIKAQSKEEALFVRRIVEFWQDKEYDFAKRQIEEFVSKFPESGFIDSFHAMLGQIAMRANNYQVALEAFELIDNEKVARSVRLKKCHCLYQLQHYTQLKQLLPHILKENLPKAASDAYHFYYAEALFREAVSFYHRGEEKSYLAKGYCQEAIPHYERLVDGAFASHAKIALAEINRLLGEYPQAAERYLELAAEETTYDNPLKESFLLYAGKMLSEFDTEKAIDTFSHLALYGVEKHEEAAYLWASLLMKEKRWEELINNQEEIFCKISCTEDYKLHYLLGEAYFHLGRFTNAVNHLEVFLLTAGCGKQEKKALLTLISICKELKMLEKLEIYWFHYMRHYGNDPTLVVERSKAQLVRAFALNEAAKKEAALNQFDAISTHYTKTPNPELREVAAIATAEKTKLLFKQKQWTRAYLSAQDYLTLFPESPHRKIIFKLAVSSITKQIHAYEKRGNLKETKPLYKNLVGNLEEVLASASLFSTSELNENERLLAKAYYALGKTQKAIQLLKGQLEKIPKKEEALEIHFLLSLCYLKQKTDPEKAIIHGEKALRATLQKNFLPEQRMLHLGLFNAYLSLGDSSISEGGLKPADHLFEAISAFPEEENTHPVSLENLLWLGRFYYDQVIEDENRLCYEEPSKAKQKVAQKGIYIFEHLFGLDREPFVFPKHLLLLEPEILKLATLYAWNGAQEKEKNLLEKMHTFQDTQPDWTWRARLKIKLALANSYLKAKMPTQALDLYSQLEKMNSAFDVEVIYQARLKSARLLFKNLLPEEKTEDSLEVIGILKKLKDLQVRKCLAYEPTHLEAAIDYAEFCTEIAPVKERPRIHLALLEQLKEEFTTKEDIWSKDYHASFELYPEKVKIYQAYMRYVDAKILALEAEIAQVEGNISTAKRKIKMSHVLFSTLREKYFFLSRYLEDKIGPM